MRKVSSLTSLKTSQEKSNLRTLSILPLGKTKGKLEENMSQFGLMESFCLLRAFSKNIVKKRYFTDRGHKIRFSSWNQIQTYH